MEILKLQAMETPAEVDDDRAAGYHTSSVVTVTTVVTIV